MKFIQKATGLIAACFLALLSIVPCYGNDGSILSLNVYVTGPPQIQAISTQTGAAAPLQSVDGVLQIPKERTITFSVGYSIPAYTIPDSGELSYQLPAGFDYDPASSGQIYDDSGNEIGTYSISSSGQVLLQFNQQTVENNQTGDPVSGMINASGKVSSDWQTNEVKTLDFGGPNGTVQAKAVPAVPFSASKTGKQIGPDTIQFSITVSSEYGTFGPVILEDTLGDNMENPDHFEVSSSMDPPVSLDEVTPFGNTILAVLSQMQAGQSATLTYDVQVAPGTAAGNLHNSVSVQSDNMLNEPVTASADTDVLYNPSGAEIEKTGQVNPDDPSKADWTITLNSNHANLNGCTLSDDFSGYDMPQTVEISPPVDGQSQITLPYTFNTDTTEQYTITYSTSSMLPINASALENTVSILNAQNIGNTAKAQIESGTVFAPLSKNGTGINGNILSWSVNLDLSRSGLPAGTTIEENGSENQYFTGSQIQAVEDYFESMNIPVQITAVTEGSGQQVSDISANENYSSFQITLKQNLPQMDQVIQIPVSSTLKGEMQNGVKYSNTASIDQIQSANADQIFGIVTMDKIDGNAPASDDSSGKSTSHDFDYSDSDKQLVWTLQIHIPQNVSYVPITLKDTLPDGVTLAGMNIAGGTDFTFDGKNGTAYITDNEIDNVNAELSDDAHEISITVPAYTASDLAGSTLEINVMADVDDFSNPVLENGKASKSFSNHASMSVSGQPDIDADQTQKVNVDYAKGLIKKNVESVTEDMTYKDNLVPYTVDVNPNAFEISDDGETVSIKDDIQASSSSADPISVELVPDSVKVYEIDAQNKETLLNPDQYSFQISQSEQDGSSIVSLRFHLPDARHLKINYEYQINGSISQEVELNNQASISDAKSGQPSSGTETKMKIANSSVSGQAKGLNIVKVDSENAEIKLNGAEFEIEVYNANTGQFDIWSKNGSDVVYTTKDDGFAVLEPPVNTLFRLKEIKAPDGYEISDLSDTFYYLASDEAALKKAQSEIPQQYLNQTQIDLDLGTVYIPNTKAKEPPKPETIDLTIHKSWVDESGSPAAAGADSIQVGLYSNLSEDKSLQTITLSSPDWETTIKDLPKTDSDGNNIEYKVVETNVPEGWKSSVQNDSDQEITIVNTKITSVALPETGSSTLLWTVLLSGLGFMTFWMLKIRQNRRERK